MKTVLLIDDEEIANYLNEMVIRSVGAFERTEVCTSGMQALDFLKELMAAGSPPPNLILLDINMPGMNGYQFLDAFATLDPDFIQPIKIVMLSSSLNEKDRTRALQYNTVSDFCSKPLSVDLVNKLLGRLYPGEY